MKTNDDFGFVNYWLTLRGQRSELHSSENKMTLTVAEFRRQLENAFAAGVRSESSKKSIFEQVFGK